MRPLFYSTSEFVTLGVSLTIFMRASVCLNPSTQWACALTGVNNLSRSSSLSKIISFVQLSVFTPKLLVEEGIGSWADGEGGADAALIMRGQANLLDDIQAVEELTEIRGLFDALDARENALRLLDATRDGDGVKIFIGAENKLFASTGCSLVIAPYRNADRSVIGAVGVLGPRHMNYARIIPMVDYTSKAIARVLGR